MTNLYTVTSHTYVCVNIHVPLYLVCNCVLSKSNRKENIIKVRLSTIAIYNPQLNITTLSMFCNTVVFV